MGGQGALIGGPVLCLAVRGNRATMAVRAPLSESPIGVQVVDNAASGQPDTFDAVSFLNEGDECEPDSTSFLSPITSGDISVIDAQPVDRFRSRCSRRGGSIVYYPSRCGYPTPR